MPTLRLPRYLDGCITDLLPDATAAVLGREPSVVPLPDGLRAVIVLVVDGLGRRLLDAHADDAPLLATAPGTTLDAVFPTTTVSNLTSLATGVPPRLHGIAGTVLGVAGRRFLPLSWTWDRLVGGDDAREDVVPEQQQPYPTLFEGMPAQGVRSVTIFWPGHIGSGLTRASLRGGEEVGATGLDATLAVALQQAVAHRDPTVVYCHHAEVDTAGHLDGPGSSRWCEELAAADAAIARAVEDLPPDVAMVVTADHGVVAVEEPGGFIEVADDQRLLEGVRAIAGDPRAPQLHVADGALEDVLATWRETWGASAEVRTREAALAEGWFGPAGDPPGAIDDQVAGHGRLPAVVGDVIVAARDPVVWVHRDLDVRGGRMPGHHGSLTDDELEIPAIVLTR